MGGCGLDMTQKTYKTYQHYTLQIFYGAGGVELLERGVRELQVRELQLPAMEVCTKGIEIEKENTPDAVSFVFFIQVGDVMQVGLHKF